MLELRLRMSLISNEYHLLPRNPNLSRCLLCNAQHRHLRNQRFRTRVLQLESQFFDSVGGVCGGDDATGPVGAPGDDGGIDAVRGEEGEDVAFAPVVDGF